MFLPGLNILAGFSAVLPCGAAEPAAEGGDSPGRGDAGLHQRLAGRPALPEREGKEKTRGHHHPVRYAGINSKANTRLMSEYANEPQNSDVFFYHVMMKQVQIWCECARWVLNDLGTIVGRWVPIKEMSLITTAWPTRVKSNASEHTIRPQRVQRDPSLCHLV